MPPQNKRSSSKGGDKSATPAKSKLLPVPVVSQQSGILTLHFESEYIQSQMVLGRPDFLAFAYTRTMMAFEMFFPEPREMALLGLGGGSIAKWCYRRHPKSRLTVIEINPHVIALRKAFQIPQVNRRFRILCEDGARFVANTPTRFDVLLIDCFTGTPPPQELCSQAFFNHCNRALTDAGLMVVNLCMKNQRRILSRISKSFDGQILLCTIDHGNTVVFACKGELLWPKTENAISMRRRLRKFEEKYGLGKALAPRC